MKAKVIFAMLVLAWTYSSQAQFLTAVGSGNNVLKETQYTNVDGSPYFFDDWKSGAIRDKNGKLSENLMIRYDGYRDEVQFLRDGKTLVVDPSLTSEFYFVVLNEETKKVESIFFRNGFDIEGYSKMNYFQILYSGKVQFIRKIKVGYIEETVNNFGTNEQVKKFVKSDVEYLVNTAGVVVAINKSRKDVTSHFGDYASQMKVYIKENKLSIKNDKDLVVILSKFDELSGN